MRRYLFLLFIFLLLPLNLSAAPAGVPVAPTISGNSASTAVDDTIHKHVHTHACEGYFRAIWRLPESVPFMAGRTYTVAAIFLILLLGRFFAIKIKFKKRGLRR